jgi:hypothetical protein
MPMFRRRDVLGSGLSVAAAALGPRAGASGWQPREIVHLLPAVSHERFLIKCSFRQPLTRAPVLRAGNQRIEGTRGDTEGAYWQFHAKGLAPATAYALGIEAADGRPLCDPWPLRTFPAPHQRAARLRILAFTCAGGYPFPTLPGQPEAFRPLAIRHALLERALSFAPDVAVANGDHIYWDQRTWFESANPNVRDAAKAIAARFGRLDPALPALGSHNETVIKRLAGPQIAGVYGTRMRSTPMFFVGDDHDYFENDEANERYVTFPPEAPNVAWARAVQHLFLSGVPARSAPAAQPSGQRRARSLRWPVRELRHAALRRPGRMPDLRLRALRVAQGPACRSGPSGGGGVADRSNGRSRYPAGYPHAVAPLRLVGGQVARMVS